MSKKNETIADNNAKTDSIMQSARNNNKATTETSVTTSGRQTFTLANLVRECGMDPKNVRNRFRKLYVTKNDRWAETSDVRTERALPRVVDKAGWVFDVADIERVRALIINDTSIDADAA